jgi:hypothetical protein
MTRPLSYKDPGYHPKSHPSTSLAKVILARQIATLTFSEISTDVRMLNAIFICFGFFLIVRPGEWIDVAWENNWGLGNRLN